MPRGHVIFCMSFTLETASSRGQHSRFHCRVLFPRILARTSPLINALVVYIRSRSQEKRESSHIYLDRTSYPMLDITRTARSTWVVMAKHKPQYPFNDDSLERNKGNTVTTIEPECFGKRYLNPPQHTHTHAPYAIFI